MDKSQTISRRSALIGALVSGAVLTMPAAAIAVSRSTASMSLAIDAHRKSMAAFDAALDECERVEMAAPAQPDCRVQVASMINGNADGSNRPIYRSSVDEIVAYSHRISCLSEASRAIWIAKRTVELERQQGELAAFRALHGITAARSGASAASGDEQDARLALIVLRPRNAAEAREKALYVASAGAFTENWSGDDVGFADRIIAALGEVMS